MNYYTLDVETYDPHLEDKGPSWVYGDGEVLVTGLFSQKTGKYYALDGNGGKKIQDLLRNSSNTIIGANIAYDIGWLTQFSLPIKEVQSQFIDVSVAESFIDEHAPYALEDLALKYLDEHKGSEELQRICFSLGWKGDFRKHLGKLWHWAEPKKQKEYRDKIRAYVISDVDQPTRIWQKQKAIMEEEGLMEAFDINMRMLKVTCAMKQHGIRFNYAQWQENTKLANELYTRLQNDFDKKYGQVNIRSPKQLGEFFTKHKVPFEWRITIRGWEPAEKKIVRRRIEGKMQNVETSTFVVKKHIFTEAQVIEQKKRLKSFFSALRIEKGRLKIYTELKYRDRIAQQLQGLGYNITVSPSCGKDFFKEQQHHYKIVQELVDLKQAGNLVSKFFGENFERFIVYHEDTDDHRIHGNFNVVGARTTSRLSATSPNLQNVPSKTVLFPGTDYEVDLALMCRECFLPDKGCIFCKADYSGQEARMLAHFATDSYRDKKTGRIVRHNAGTMIRQMYNDDPNLDEHQFVASRSGLEQEYSKPVARKYAKNVRFGVQYGMHIIRMAKNFGWALEFCEDLYNAVLDASPWLKFTMEAVQERVKETGFIKTVLGRRIHIRNFEKMSWQEKQSAKVYQFLNYLIQGSSSDQTKKAQVLIYESETVDRLGLTVHDEGDSSIKMNNAGYKRMCEIIDLMVNAIKLKVPVRCEPELGPDWGHMEGQAVWTEKDYEEGRCEKEQVGEFKETLKEFWDRMCLKVKTGEKVQARTFDFEVLDADEDEEEDEE